MKEILCFGDSLTYGYNPENCGRYPYEERYPGILQRLLGDNYRVVEEGLNGRLIGCDDPIWESRNALKTVDMLLESHAPVDAVVLMLGNNDTKKRIGLSPADIDYSFDRLLTKILCSDFGRDMKAPALLVITPPRIGELSGDFLEMYGEDAPHKLNEVIRRSEATAARHGAAVLKAHLIVSPSELDGVHLRREDNAKLAAAVCGALSRMCV